MASRYAFPKTVKELRFHLCQTTPSSQGLRTFLQKSYPVIKKHNPNVPILIREAFGVPARVFARYEYGQESKVTVDGLSEKECEDVVEKLVKQQPVSQPTQ